MRENYMKQIINEQVIKSFKDSLTDEQKKEINFYLNVETDKEMMNEIKPLDFTINVITTYEYEEQEIFDVKIKNIYPSKVCSMTTEADVLSQVIEDMERNSDRNLDYLMKISLCYIHGTISIDGELQNSGDTPETHKQFLEDLDLLKVIERSNGKYYFQPNQRDIVVSKIVNTFNVANLTPDFDMSDHVKSMSDSPMYLKGKYLALLSRSITTLLNNKDIHTDFFKFMNNVNDINNRTTKS